MNTKLLAIIGILSLVACVSNAQNTLPGSSSLSFSKYEAIADSVLPGNRLTLNRMDYAWGRFAETPFFQTITVGVPLLAAGLLMKEEDRKFSKSERGYLPEFRNNPDDYLQIAPMAAVYGLKLFGIHGRSSWPELLTTNALAGAIMVGTVNLFKKTTHVMRPDGSDNRSFPSGHTATAFMAATLLHKEYGTLSPWYSIGGYAVAGTTAMLRQINHKHWASDVFVSAGIGILSVEAAYWISDLIFRKKEKSQQLAGFSAYTHLHTYSSLGLYASVDLFPGSYSLIEKGSLRFHSGNSIGVQGYKGISPYWGVIGRYSFTRALVSYNGTPLHSQEIIDHPSRGKSNSLQVQTLETGMQYSHPVSLRWRVGAKATGGYTYYHKIYNDASLPLGNRGGLNVGGGVNLEFFAQRNLGVRAFFDYRYNPPLEHGSSRGIHQLMIGSVASIVF